MFMATPEVTFAQANISPNVAAPQPIPNIDPNNVTFSAAPASVGASNQGQGLKNLENKLANSCDFTDFFTLRCITYGIAGISYAFLNVVGVILYVAGMLFNATLGVTIDNQNYTAGKITALQVGWEFSRDVGNLFIIFILLFIAIATILQVESYGARALLVRLIIIALLINFSFLAAQTIIFVSNALSVTLYKSITAPEAVLPFTANASNGLSFKYHNDISAAVVNAFSPQQLLLKVPQDPTDRNLSGIWAEIKVQISIIEICIIGSIIILAVSFVLIVESFFFISRMAILWLLMILAPFGFLLLILPVTRGFAMQWWSKLTKQALHAPVFMFLLAIKIIIIQKGLNSLLGQAGNIGVSELLFLIFMFGTIVVILDVVILMAAQLAGTYGAGGAMKLANNWGKSARNWGRDAFVKRPISSWSKNRLESEGRVSQALRSLPGGGRLLAGGANLNAKEVKEYEKKYASYGKETLQNLSEKSGRNFLNRNQKTAIDNLLGKHESATKKAEKDREERKEEDIILKGPMFTAEEKLATLVKRERRRSSEAQARATEAESRAQEAEEKAEEAGVKATRVEAELGTARDQASATKPEEK